MLFAAQVRVVSIDPILTGRREDVEVVGILKGLGAVRHVRGDDHGLSFADDDGLAIDFKFERTFQHVGDLLVLVAVYGNEQITYVLEGALEFEIDGKTIVVGKGQAMVIPSNMPHGAKALEDTDDLDVFTPPRQDWIDGDDAYLRGK